MKIIAIAAALAATLAAAPAQAQTAGQAPILVAHADLDLATSQGRAALDLRLLHAARTACGTPSPADPLGRTRLDACVADARAAAAAQIESAIALARRQAPAVLATR
ncbi:MAG TPA: UrcA family protein [Allosphingosinicella sp.]|nr:UrcA family protein [Allosphingosinicella sp.]